MVMPLALSGSSPRQSADIPRSANCPVAAEDNVPDLDRFLARLAEKIAKKQPVTILAIGSSSTEGIGAEPGEDYPSQLQAMLDRAFPGQQIEVINAGKGWDMAADMLKRMNEIMAVRKIDAVFWQAGSNTALNDLQVDAFSDTMRAGIKRIQAADADAVLIDPQYTLVVMGKPGTLPIVRRMKLLADESNIGELSRYGMFQDLVVNRYVPFETFSAPDKIHMNGCGYRLVAEALFRGIQKAVRQQLHSTDGTPLLARPAQR